MTGRITGNLIEVRQGDSFTINLQVKRGCKPVNVTGATVMMQVRDSANNLVMQVDGTPVDAENGRMALIITPDLSAISVGDYSTDIQITMPDGSVNTVFPENVNAVGVFRITKQVTEG